VGSSSAGVFTCKADVSGFYSIVFPLPVERDRMISLEFQLLAAPDGTLPAAGVVNQINVRGKPVLSIAGGSRPYPYWRSISVGGTMTPEVPISFMKFKPNTWYRLTSIQQGSYYLIAIDDRETMHFDDELMQFGTCSGVPAVGLAASLSGKGDQVIVRKVTVTTKVPGITRDATPDHPHWADDDKSRRQRERRGQ
jgi:hypothetical protein